MSGRAAALLVDLQAAVDAAERAAQQGVEPAEQARLDAEVRRLVVAVVAGMAGPPVARSLLREGADWADQLSADGERDTGAFVAAVVARLVLDFGPILKSVLPAFPSEVVARDLLEASKPDGASPLVLPVVQRGRGKRDHRDLKAQARRRLVLAVYQEAARRVAPVDRMARELAGLGERSWRELKQEVPVVDRQAATAVGETGEANPDLAVIKDLARQALG